MDELRHLNLTAFQVGDLYDKIDSLTQENKDLKEIIKKDIFNRGDEELESDLEYVLDEQDVLKEEIKELKEKLAEAEIRIERLMDETSDWQKIYNKNQDKNLFSHIDPGNPPPEELQGD